MWFFFKISRLCQFQILFAGSPAKYICKEMNRIEIADLVSNLMNEMSTSNEVNELKSRNSALEELVEELKENRNRNKWRRKKIEEKKIPVVTINAAIDDSKENTNFLKLRLNMLKDNLVYAKYYPIKCNDGFRWVKNGTKLIDKCFRLSKSICLSI